MRSVLLSGVPGGRVPTKSIPLLREGESHANRANRANRANP